MKQPVCFENYPLWMVFVSNLVSVLTYLAGAIIIFQVGVVWAVLYLIFIGALEFKLIKGHCVDCYYYGKRCTFGKGKLSSWFFKKGNSKKFAKIKITWKNILPDFLVSIIPILVGIALLIINFNLLILTLIILLIILTSAGNGFVRGALACNHCKQRKLGCPAERLFSKK